MQQINEITDQQGFALNITEIDINNIRIKNMDMDQMNLHISRMFYVFSALFALMVLLILSVTNSISSSVLNLPIPILIA